jgi:hypothetical protein
VGAHLGRYHNMKRFIRKRKRLVLICAIYLSLWLITATWGLIDIDRQFDRQFSSGYKIPGTSKVVPNIRLSNIDPRNPFGAKQLNPGLFWRYRSKGTPIAPFIVVDDVAYQDGSMMGYAGKRLVFWCFGLSASIPLAMYWMS